MSASRNDASVDSEIAALGFFYEQPYQRRALTFDMIEDLHDFGTGAMREVTLALVLMALGDALMGGPLSQAIELPRTAARDVAEKMLVEAAERAGIPAPLQAS